MPESLPDEVEVLSGRHGDLHWQVWAGGTEADLMTMLKIFRGDQLVDSSGFGGPALFLNEKVNEWRGRADDLPYFVMARSAREVSRLVAVTDRGTRIELKLSEVDSRFGLRFAAAGLPDGEGPGVLIVEVDGQPAGSLRQEMF